ncbi:MAG: hypothetical protein AB1744_05340 [Candidatus Zixiibacteriota bacterium]
MQLRSFSRLTGCVCLVALASCICAQPQQPDIAVGDVDLSKLSWGKQVIEFQVTNNTAELKFLTVESELKSTDSYLAPKRKATSSHILLPNESKSISHTMYIPGVLGRMDVELRLYDVVDTLDILLPGQKFFEQPFMIKFRVPDALHLYLDERLDLPPMVNSHPAFDSELMRVLLLLIHEGRSVAEIADMTEADTAFIKQMLDMLIQRQYVTSTAGDHRLHFPMVDIPEAEEAVRLADELSTSLVSTIGLNLTAYDHLLDSLIAAKLVQPDTNVFMDGGGILHRPYPMLGGLLLWYYLGREFISDTLPLEIYAGSDPCNAGIGDYMYAVRGGSNFNGTHFFMLTLRYGNYQILFADQIPELDCGADFASRARYNRPVSWGYKEPYIPESFMLDTTVVMPMLKMLANKTEALLSKTEKQLASIAARHGHSELTNGYRYWFWNIVATRTLNQMVEQGLVKRRGNGFFKMDGLPPSLKK